MELLVDAIRNMGEGTMGVPRDSKTILPTATECLPTELVQTMVFVNTAEIARQISRDLQERGILNCEYHNMILETEKQVSLKRFRENEVPVLVCTDHAARGLDLPHVRHVVQAEFALNVVQHLHRIGRASRAGVQGKATNFYDIRSKDLVQSILSDSSGQNKVDQSFSRRRGFRAKLKKEAQKDR
jgi:superfamily II DNA/RNA helicase